MDFSGWHVIVVFFFFKQKTAYEMRISDWSSDVCSSDLGSDIGTPLDDWMAPEGTTPEPVAIEPPDGFNIIYSSGTTGTPKGIVHSHAMRWQHIQRGVHAYGPQAVTILSTPVDSNTPMANFRTTAGSGGTTVWGKELAATGFLD